MQKSERIVRHTAAEIDHMLARGEDRTDYARLDAMTEEELEASIDFEDEGEFDWSTGQPGLGGFKQLPSVPIDRDVLDWFKAQGDGYVPRINEVLRRYVEARKHAEPSSRS